MAETKHTGFGIVFFPSSWAFGPWDKGHKWLFAVGPFRFVIHRGVIGTYGETHG